MLIRLLNPLKACDNAWLHVWDKGRRNRRHRRHRNRANATAKPQVFRTPAVAPCALPGSLADVPWEIQVTEKAPPELQRYSQSHGHMFGILSLPARFGVALEMAEFCPSMIGRCLAPSV